MLSMRTTAGDSPFDVPWPVKDVVYVAIVGSVMLAALLEWILWLLVFLYCLVKVFQKASHGQDRWAVRTLCVLNMIFFIGMRLVFLPIMIVTLPLPSRIVRYFPEEMVTVLQYFAFWSFAGLLTIPWLFCVYQLVTHNIGRERKLKTVLDEHTAPKVVVVMPCYNEAPEILLRTVDSLVDCEYPPSCLHIFLSFDGDQENELYLNTIKRLGVPITLEKYPKCIDVTYRSCRITVSRFPHGGKRSCQKRTFKLIDKVYAEYLRRNDNLFLLFIDSDCILDRVCIQNFMYEMELKPGSERNMLAMTGVITSTTVKNTLITVLQDMEYIHGQLFERSVESGCGAVTCLPGALTILRFSAFRKMAKFYFADKAEQCDDLFDYGKCHLGEDRWLTHLFMIGAKKRYQIQMNTGALCKTEAVQSFKSLLKQRRRFHHQRGVHADRHKTLEAIPNSSHHPPGSEHYSNDWSIVLHHGHIDHHDKPEDNESARWIHRSLIMLELVVNGIFRSKAWKIQDHAISDHVCHQSVHELDLYGVRDIHSQPENVGRPTRGRRESRRKDNSK